MVGNDDQVTIKNWFSTEDDQLDAIYADDHVLLRNQVDLLVNAMAAYDVSEGVDAIVPQDIRTVLTTVWQVTA